MSSLERAQDAGARLPIDPTSSEGADSGASAGGGELAAKVAGSAVSLAGRRVALLLLTGLSTAVIARLLGPSEYGAFGSAIATWTVVLAASDFGFSLLLGRELAVQAENRGRLLATAYQLQGLWSLVLTLLMAGLALASGLEGVHGQTLLVLTPSVAVSALNSARILSTAIYQTKQVVAIDVAVSAAQVALMIVAGLLDLGAVGVAAMVCAGSIVNILLVARWAHRRSPLARPTSRDRRRMLRDVLPLGLAGFMSKVYLLIDLVLLGWLVSGPTLGDYAAASRLLSVLITVPGLIVAAALPAFSSTARSVAELSDITTRVWHWLLVFTMPVFVATGVCAPLAIDVAVGPDYHGAIELLRILSVAGAVGVLSTFLGTILVAKGLVRILLWQNAVAVIFNVVGNLVLVPSFGVVAAAWLTLATELIVCGSAAVVLARGMPVRPWLRISLRPTIALAGGAASAVVLGRWQVASLTVGALVFLVLLAVVRGWPPEMRLPRLLPSRTSV